MRIIIIILFIFVTLFSDSQILILNNSFTVNNYTSERNFNSLNIECKQQIDSSSIYHNILLNKDDTLKGSYTNYGTNILIVANKFSEGGYQWGGISGVCIPLYYNGKLIRNYTKGDKTHCVGFTLSVAFVIAINRNLFKGKYFDSIHKFSSEWYSEGGINGKLCVDAIKNLGIGIEVTLSEAKSGDFCQIWRTNGSGHSVIFINHIINDNDKMIGMKYRSSQKSTNGIGDREEYYSDTGKGKMDKKYTYFGRLN